MYRIAIGILLIAPLVAGCAPPPPAAPLPEPAPAPAPVEARADTFARPTVRPLPLPDFFAGAVERGTRTLTGEPGPAYWQNHVSYRIEAELDPATATIQGFQRIVYSNRSPGPLSSVVLNLYQNIFSEGIPRNRQVTITGGVTLQRVAAGGQTLQARTTREIPVTFAPPPGSAPGYAVQGTLARVQLPRSVAPGESVVIEIDWSHRIPPAPSFRTGWEEALGSRAFHVAQWYPQIATYDDLRGWATTPYLGDGEFYLEYGDFDVSLTVPAGYLIAATGELRNPEEVLTDVARERLRAARGADTITRIVTGADLAADNATLPSLDDRLTWRFTASDVRDFAFATSDGYVWDATRAVLPDGAGGTRTIAIHALYRSDAPNWNQAARYTQHSLTYIARRLTPYIYPQMSVAEGPIYGMEYPMLALMGRPPIAESLYRITAHEVAHQWFPMMVGSDEAAYAWLDEGIASYLENLAAANYFDIDDPFGGDLSSYLAVAGGDAEVPMMRHTDLVSPFGDRVAAAYAKPSLLMRALAWTLGEDDFDTALRTLADEWLLRRPNAWDFFHTLERVAGRDLDWLFHPWWFETATLDQAITEVVGAESGELRITVEDRGDIPAPALLVATTAAGDTVTVVVPVETWLSGHRTTTVSLHAPGPVVRVVIDPEQIFPDVDFRNNVWPRGTDR